MRYKFAKDIDVILEKEGGVVYNESNEKFFGVDFIGAIICEQIQNGVDTDDIIQLISGQYKTDIDTITTDVNEFVELLLKNSLIEIEGD